MRVLIFSDTHLSHKFESRKFTYLSKIISRSDRVIINGDFWDGERTSFEKFINSEWKKLFPLLLERKTVYLHGNHDPAKLCDSRIRQFCTANNDEYEFNADNRSYLVQHGDRIVHSSQPGIIKVYSALMASLTKAHLYSLVQKFIRGTMRLGYFVLGAEFMTTTSIAKNNNRVMKNLHRPSDKVWLICSDTHFPEIDLREKFINTGCILYGHASYLRINNGKMELIKERY
jgi:UDP-2,3-diacylglucosamine pyrophosphatase LpxH